MTQPTNTFSSYDAIGNREDLTDVIYNIAPTETPFLSGISRASAQATLHEWQTDTLASAAQNAVIEGDDATTDASTATTRLGNYTQISDKVPRVTGTQQAVRKAGRKDELAYQIAKSSKELKRDMETDLLSNNARNAGNDTTARVSAGVPSWIATNTDRGSGGSDPSGDGTDTATNGTQRNFLESQLKTVLQACWNEGGDPDTVMVGSFNKQIMSTFTGNATRYKDADDQRLVAAIDVYVSDFGSLTVVPNRFQPARNAFVFQMDMWAAAYLRPFFMQDLAKTGDTERRQLLVEYCLEARQEAASGTIADLNTS